MVVVIQRLEVVGMMGTLIPSIENVLADSMVGVVMVETAVVVPVAAAARLHTLCFINNFHKDWIRSEVDGMSGTTLVVPVTVKLRIGIADAMVDLAVATLVARLNMMDCDKRESETSCFFWFCCLLGCKIGTSKRSLWRIQELDCMCVVTRIVIVMNTLWNALIGKTVFGPPGEFFSRQ
jgi:hypothetical protein